jgi:hypothetical protein
MLVREQNLAGHATYAAAGIRQNTAVGLSFWKT